MPVRTATLFGSNPKQTAIIVYGSAARCRDLETIENACDCIVIATFCAENHDTNLGDQPSVDFLPDEFQSILDDALQYLEELARYLLLNQHSHALL